MLPDEDIMVIAAWRRAKVHPRRGGGEVPEIAVAADAVQAYREFVGRAWRPEWFDRLPQGNEVYYPCPPARYAPEIFEHGRSAARQWLAGTTPEVSAMSAAVLALITCHSLDRVSGSQKAVAAWVATGGYGFAGRALAELAGIVWLPGADTRSLLAAITDPDEWAQLQRWYDENRDERDRDPRAESSDHADAEVLFAVAKHLRRLAAAADDEDYRQLVAALAQMRGTFPQRCAASYVAPTETAWVDQDCAELADWVTQRWHERRTELDDGRALEHVMPTPADRMLFFTASTVRHLEHLLPVPGASLDRDEIVATILDGVGPDAARMLVSGDAFGDELYFWNRFWGGDFTDEAVELLRGLAADDAFRLLADATLRAPGYHKKSRVAQMLTAPAFLRCPARALRLLAERAEGGDPIDLDVLAVRVFHDVAVTEQAMPLLPEPARSRVAALLAGQETAIGDGLRAHLLHDDGVAADHKRLLTATARLPVAGALRVLLDQLDDRYVRQTLLAEGRRQPQRMVRMLAEQAEAGHHAAEELLRGQVLAYPQAAETAVQTLEPGARRRVEAILVTARPRADAAPATLVPAVLQSPTGKRAKPPALPGWVVVPALPPIWLRGGRQTLPLDAVHRLCGLFATAKPAAVPAGVPEVRRVADPQSLARFAWALVEQWQTASFPGDQLALAAVAAFGDEATVARLAGFLPDWSRSAVWLYRPSLDALATIGTDAALTHLQRLARKAETKASRRQAEERMTRIAHARGLSEAELADRIVPDLGLDADGRMSIDYGPRQFTVHVDEQLQPVVTGPDGKRLKQLPKPSSADDPVLAVPAHEAFKQLRKDIGTVTKERVLALERAMVEQRAWRFADFRALLAGHPLMTHVVRRLVWTTGGGATFRLAEDRTLADFKDETLQLADDEPVRVAHPLLLSDAQRAAWTAVFDDYEILQPFAQLTRKVFEPGQATLAEVVGAKVDAARLHALAAREWLIGSESDLRRPCSDELVVVLRFSPHLGWNDGSQPHLIEGVEVRRGTDGDAATADLTDLTPIEASEVLRDVHGLTG